MRAPRARGCVQAEVRTNAFPPDRMGGVELPLSIAAGASYDGSAGMRPRFGCSIEREGCTHMSSKRTLDPSHAALLVVDMQENFRAAIEQFDAVAQRIARLAAGARLLGVPVVVTEQYPKGLGHTVGEIRSALADDQPIVEKTAFSACGQPGFIEKLGDVRQVVLCGIETHVCVNQTALDLLDRGIDVHVIADCVSSRKASDRDAGLHRMQRAGATCSTLEMALFELMKDARHPQFKAVQKLVK